MLSKLIHYDFRSTGRAFGPTYLVVLALSVLYTILNHIPHANSRPLTALFDIICGLYILSLFAMFLLTLIFCIKYFYDNLFKDEGYLMHTLPVAPAQLLWSKIIIGGVWTLASCAVAFVSLWIASLPGIRSDIRYDREFLQFCQQALNKLAENPEYIGVLLLSILTIIAGLIFVELLFYTSMSIGSLVKRHHRIVAVLVLIGFMIAHTILLGILSTLSDIQEVQNFVERVSFSLNEVQEMCATLGCVLAYFVLFIGVNFVINNVIMKKHLNLE